MEKKKCLQCDKPFEPNHGKQKFCSDKCKVAYSRAQKKSVDPGLNKFDGVFKKIAKESGLPDNTWQQSIEEYCGIIGMTPAELIADHKRMAGIKSFRMPDQIDKSKFKFATLDDLSEQNQERGKKKDYNPNDNWRFKSKMGKEKPSQE